ncbi:MAG: Flp pilus assembly complex ATPase component TadA [Candidatus Omnitrophica bacterium]|nr:Flp pilus assembly complex ATPase component TadA [Candidatus Omnitrophota bacterium]
MRKSTEIEWQNSKVLERKRVVRKKEYRIGAELVKRGLVTPEHVQEGLQIQARTGGYLGRALVKLGYLREADLLRVLADQLSVQYIDLKNCEIQETAIKKVPAKFATHYRLIPIRLERNTLTICVADPLEVGTVDDLRTLLNCEVKLAISDEMSILEAIKKHYGIGASALEQVVSDEMIRGAGSGNSGITQTMEALDVEDRSKDASMVRFVNQILLEASESRATDIHIEPFEDEMKIRYRIDGILYDAKIPPNLKQFQSSIVSRIKIVANLDIAEHRLPQDGRFKIRAKDKELDLRVSILPTPYGESVNIRLLTTNIFYGLDKIGFSQKNLAILEEVLKKPHGIIFLTGPTGSGKTTTLYACLNKINDHQRKIITIEDPIEYQMKDITQIQIQPKIGLTFSSGLRSMLRHDPDIMMVGEVRDTETAEITIRVALTGHLVFSTLHTNDAPGGIARLLDMAIEPFLVVSSVECIIAQRLVRLICSHCKEKAPAGRGNLLGNIGGVDLGKVVTYRGRGCERCNHTGYSGRTAIHEVLLMSDKIRELCLARASSTEIRRQAAREGMRSLREDGWEKIAQGITTVEEVVRVTQEQVSNV